MLTSQLCRFADFSTDWYRAREQDLGIRSIYEGHSAQNFDFVNRKFWEWCVISEALDERGFLAPGRRALGFAVGTEPLASYFAAKGVDVLATDLAADLSNDGWKTTGQHAAAKDALYHHQLIDRARFDALVAFQPADMRTLEGLSGGYDFLWSSCALEHLGSLQAGLDYVIASADLLKPGGIAVHTTEINIRSNDETVETPSCVIYRQRDIGGLDRALAQRGFRLAKPDYDPGSDVQDLRVDTEPYMTSGIPHLKLQIEDHVCTSMILIVERQVGGLLSRFARFWPGAK